MDVSCQRCGVTLSPSQVFCHNCGSPQLQIEPADIVAADEGVGPTAVAPSRDIAWKAAIRAALIVFLPVALLASVMNFNGVLGIWGVWSIGGGMAAVALYSRRSTGVLDARSGLRIGLVVGLLVALTTSALDAVSILVQRLGTHSAHDIDESWKASVQQMEQNYMQATHPDPVSAAQIVSMIRFYQSADGKAAGILVGCAVMALGIIVFSAVGGALGSRVFAARPIRFRRS